MNNRRTGLLALLTLTSMPVGVFAQPAEKWLGDATVTPGLHSKFGPYGLNTEGENSTSATFGTRHYRLGDESGIGNSFSGTTAATSESQSLSMYKSPGPVTYPAASSPATLNKPGFFSETMRSSPALSSIHYAEPVAADNNINSPLKSEITPSTFLKDIRSIDPWRY